MVRASFVLLCVCLTWAGVVHGGLDTYGLVQVQTGSVTESRLGDTGSCPVRPWTDAQTKARERYVEIVFDEPFKGPPSVLVSVTQEDIDRRYNLRFKTAAQEVTEKGFTLFIGTWCNTYIYSIRVDYIAVGLRNLPDCGACTKPPE